MSLFSRRNVEFEPEKIEVESSEKNNVVIAEKNEETNDGKLKMEDNSADKCKEFRDSMKNFDPVETDVKADGKLDSENDDSEFTGGGDGRELSLPKGEDGR